MIDNLKEMLRNIATMKDPIVQLIMESMRFAVLGGISLFITKALELLGAQPDQNMTIVVLTMVLRGIDNVLHKSKVAKFGITRF